MGSLFSQSVPRYSPVSYTPQTQGRTVASSDEDGDATLKTSQQSDGGNSAEEESIKDIIRRNTRGRNSLIQTSYRGVLTDVSSLSPQRKKFIGRVKHE